MKNLWAYIKKKKKHPFSKFRGYFTILIKTSNILVTLNKHDYLQWYDIVHFDHKLSWWL